MNLNAILSRSQSTDSKYYIVDLSPIIYKYNHCFDCEELACIDIYTMVSLLLQYDRASEIDLDAIIYDHIDNLRSYMPVDYHSLNDEKISFLYMAMLEDLDELIRIRIKNDNVCEEVIFENWIDNRSILLKVNSDEQN